jgi:hypothetical protein
MNQLIPPPEMDAEPPAGLTPGQRIELWAANMDLAHEVLMAGLRHKVGLDGDVQSAYRQWYARQMEEHDAMMRHMADRLYQAGVRHGG